MPAPVAGAALEVRFDPVRPRRAVLERGRSGAFNYGVLAQRLAVLGLFLVYLGYRR